MLGEEASVEKDKRRAVSSKHRIGTGSAVKQATAANKKSWQKGKQKSNTVRSLIRKVPVDHNHVMGLLSSAMRA